MSKTQIKILHIIDTMAMGGAELLLLKSINELESFEHHLMVLNGHETINALFKNNFKFINLEMTGWNKLWSTIIKIRKYVKENKIEIVHSHLWKSIAVSRMAIPNYIPLINSIHSPLSKGAYEINKLSFILDKLTYKKRHCLLGVSKYVLEDFDKWVGIKGEAIVLYNFIDDNFFLNKIKPKLSSTCLKLVAVGNIKKSKNYEFIIEAFKGLPKNISLDIYGEGDLRGELQEKIDLHGLNIKFCGVSHSLHGLYSQYDAFVMSSLYEGYGLALVEAMASGLPAIISDIPVFREIAQNNALYFDLRDPASFKRIIFNIQNGTINVELFKNEGRNIAIGIACKEIYIKKLEEIYKAKVMRKLKV